MSITPLPDRDDLLARLLDDVRAGGDVEALTSSYPDVAEELSDLVQTLRAFSTAADDWKAVATQFAPVAPCTGVENQPTQLPSDEPPRQIGRYRIDALLGRGGMGRVYRAFDPDLNRAVAVKVPHADGSRDYIVALRKRFLREARAMAGVRHPHVCPIHDVGEQAGVPFAVMQLVEGESLAARLHGDTRFDDVGAVARLGQQIAAGLQAIHDAGLVHRDVKPANILLEGEDKALLADFGLARAVEGGEGLTSPGVLVGTPAYMAPEQVSPTFGPVGPQTDIYALGVVLYRMLTGRQPFAGPPEKLFDRLLTEDPPPPSSHRPDVPPRLEAIVLQAMARRPEDRYQSASALVNELGNWSAGDPEPQPEAPARSVPTRVAAKLPDGRDVTITIDSGSATPPRELKMTVREGRRSKKSRLGMAFSITVAFGLLLCIGLGFYWVLPVDHPFLPHGHTGPVTSVVFSPDGTRLASASEDKTVRLWDARTGQQTLELKGHAGPVSSVCFSPDGTRLATASGDKEVTVRLWDARTGQLLDHLPLLRDIIVLPHESQRPVAGQAREIGFQASSARSRAVELLPKQTGPVSSLCFSPDGTRLAGASMDNSVPVWDVRLDHLSCTFQRTAAGAVTSVCFSPDGTRLATASADGTVSLLDAPTGLGTLKYKGHTGVVSSVCFSPDGTRLATASEDKTVRLWDARTGQQALELKEHTGAVSSVCFSPDGTRLASASHDQTVRLWDARTGQQILTLRGHTLPVTSVVFSPDGTRLASASYDKTVRLWDARTGLEVPALKGYTASAEKGDAARKDRMSLRAASPFSSRNRRAHDFAGRRRRFGAGRGDGFAARCAWRSRDRASNSATIRSHSAGSFGVAGSAGSLVSRHPSEEGTSDGGAGRSIMRSHHW